MDKFTNSVDLIEAEIRHYVALHPYSADTAQGIRDWWLQAKFYTIEEVEQALERLVDDHVLIRKQLANGTVLFFTVCPKIME